MDEQYSWKRTEEIEINLADLLKQLGMQWKQILLCALAAALLAGGYSYIKNRNNASVMEEAEDTELTAEELASVMSAVELHGDIRMQEEYMEGSVLMKADPYHKHRVYMLYSIDGADRRDIQKITESYLNFIVNGGAADALQKSGSRDWDMDKSYLAELLTAYQKTYDSSYYRIIESAEDADKLTESIFYAEVTGLNEEKAGQLASDLQRVLEKQYEKIRKRTGSHKLTLLSTEHNVFADSSLLAQQLDRKAQQSSNTANLKVLTDAFNDKQMAVYQKEAEIEEEKLEKDSDTNDSIEETVLESNRNAGSAAVSFKYIILGLAGGIFIYCGVYGCWYLFRDTIKSEEEMKNLYTFPVYGGISFEKQAGEGMLNRIRLACKRQGIEKLCLASDFTFDAKEKDDLETMAQRLDGYGIHTMIAENAGGSDALWDTMMETGNVLIVCRIGTTTHRMIDDAVRFYLENGISVMGAVMFYRRR